MHVHTIDYTHVEPVQVTSNLFLNDYDTSTPLLYHSSAAEGDGRQKLRVSAIARQIIPEAMSFALSASASRDHCWFPRLLASTFDRWDAVHFAGISTSGYVYGKL